MRCDCSVFLPYFDSQLITQLELSQKSNEKVMMCEIYT